MCNSRRRGSVVLLAIAVVALMFIIGSTFLMISYQEHKTATEAAEARDFRAIHDALTNHALLQLRGDVARQNNGPNGDR